MYLLSVILSTYTLVIKTNVGVPMIYGPYILKAARGLLGWTQEGLAKEAGVAVNTIRRLESLTDWKKTWESPSVGTVNKIQTAFEKANIEFLNDGEPGVRLKK